MLFVRWVHFVLYRLILIILCASLQDLSEKIFVKFHGDIFFLLRLKILCRGFNIFKINQKWLFRCAIRL